MSTCDITNGAANRVTAATVFDGTARITRRATCAIDRGINRIRIEVLAHRVHSDSLLARVHAPGELLGVQYREVAVPKASDELLRDLENQLELARQREAQCAAADRMIERQLSFLDNAVEFAKVQVPAEIQTHMPTASEIGATLDLIGARYGSLGEQKVDSETALKEARQDRETLERRLADVAGEKSHRRRSVEVLFRADKSSTETRVEVDYRVDGARWTPTYKVDVNEDLSSVQLALLARVEQRTGEAWQDATLTLSTGQSHDGADLPRPQDWRLSPPRPAQAKLRATAMMAGSAPRAASEESLVLEDVEAAAPMAQATRNEHTLSIEYTPSATFDVPSGGDATLVPVETTRPQGEFFHTCVPRVDPRAYLTCRIEPGVDLLPGALNVHVGGNLVASTSLGALPAGSPLEINLGRDRQIAVRRELLKDHKSETLFGMIERGNTAREFRYRVRIDNRKKEAIRVRLFDAEPVPSTDRIEVKGVVWTPAPERLDHDGRQGVHRWNLDIEPGKHLDVELAFHVKYPKDETPVGLG